MHFQNIFIIMFKILDALYRNYNQNECLASLLSDMDPSLFDDGKPADAATYNDWLKIVKPRLHSGTITDSEILLALIEFLEFYQKEYGYTFQDIIQYFKEHFKEVIDEMVQFTI